MSMDAYLSRIYQSDTARYVDALAAAHMDTQEQIEEQRQERVKDAFINDLRAYAKTQPAFALYHVAHWCECGTLISHSQNAFDAHKGHGGFINIDLEATA